MPKNRDLDIIEHILRYCGQVQTAHDDFGFSKDRFFTSTTCAYNNKISHSTTSSVTFGDI